MTRLTLAPREIGARLSHVDVHHGCVTDPSGRIVGLFDDGVVTLERTAEAALAPADLSGHQVDVLEPGQAPRRCAMVRDVLYCRGKATYWLDDGILWSDKKPLPGARLRRLQPTTK